MLLLIAKSSAQIRALRAEGLNVGRLLGPRDRKPDVAGLPWAADNDAFNGFDERRFLSMVEAIKGVPGCLFVTAPDVVGDRDTTLEQYHDWFGVIADRGLPVAYVAQDGEEGSTIPESCAAVFIGGTTEYKLGPLAVATARRAKQLGKFLHVGRVNSLRRIRFAHSIGADSIDGTKWAKFSEAWKHQIPLIDQGAMPV